MSFFFTVWRAVLYCIPAVLTAVLILLIDFYANFSQIERQLFPLAGNFTVSNKFFLLYNYFGKHVPCYLYFCREYICSLVDSIFFVDVTQEVYGMRFFFRKILNKFPFLRFVSSLIYLSNGDEIALISVLSKFNDKK